MKWVQYVGKSLWDAVSTGRSWHLGEGRGHFSPLCFWKNGPMDGKHRRTCELFRHSSLMATLTFSLTSARHILLALWRISTQWRQQGTRSGDIEGLSLGNTNCFVRLLKTHDVKKLHSGRSVTGCWAVWWPTHQPCPGDLLRDRSSMCPDHLRLAHLRAKTTYLRGCSVLPNEDIPICQLITEMQTNLALV